MKITIEIDQKELRELLGKGEKEETISKKGYIMYFQYYEELFRLIKDANHIIDEFGFISWDELLELNHIRPNGKSYKAIWDKRFTFYGEDSVEIHTISGGRSKYKLIFPRPDIEL